MAFIPVNPVKAMNRFDGKGEITMELLLTPTELNGKCDLFAKVTIPPGCSLGYHEHHGNTETYHFLAGKALYSDNGTPVEVTPGTTTYCPDGEGHGVENIGDTDVVFMALIIKS